MTAKPFNLDHAKDALTAPGDYLLPICGSKPTILMGEDLAVLVFTTVEDQRVGVPLGREGLSKLREAVGRRRGRGWGGAGR